jgi:hypothetical protein
LSCQFLKISFDSSHTDIERLGQIFLCRGCALFDRFQQQPLYLHLTQRFGPVLLPHLAVGFASIYRALHPDRLGLAQGPPMASITLGQNHLSLPNWRWLCCWSQIRFHPLSHHANNKDRIDKLVRVQTYHVQRFADFVDKLAKTPDGDGSLLDHSLLMYGSNMSNSDRHNNYPLPNILVGGANGQLKGGQHITLPEYTTFSNLHLTVVNKAGLELTSIGDSTGEIAGV